MMSQAVEQEQKNLKIVIALFLGMLLYKVSLDVSYWVFFRNVIGHRVELSPIKYVGGLIWCCILFFGIRHTQRKASSFLLYMVYMFQIIPITTIYSVGNNSSEYYNILCLGFLLCEIIAGHIEERPLVLRNLFISKVMCLCFVAAAILVILVVIFKQGLPSLTALNLLKVYKLRNSSSFQLNKYLNYIFEWTVKIFLPVALTKSLLNKRYGCAAAVCGITLLMYLYTGHKTFLFSIPLVLVGALWAKRKECYKELFLLGSGGFSAVALLTCVFSDEGGILRRYLYSLFIRRMMFVSANNKFLYFDYFSQRPKMGLYGMFPRWIVNIESYYENIPYTYKISEIYYHAPEMNSNTGFLAEGYMRFGHIGTILLLVLFALLLKQVDRLQERTSYPFAIGMFIYPVFSLSDGHLLDAFVLGTWMILLFFLLFYHERPSKIKESPLEYQRIIPKTI